MVGMKEEPGDKKESMALLNKKKDSLTGIPKILILGKLLFNLQIVYRHCIVIISLYAYLTQYTEKSLVIFVLSVAVVVPGFCKSSRDVD